VSVFGEMGAVNKANLHSAQAELISVTKWQVVFYAANFIFAA
jgi:hypothetical protein